MALYIGSNIAVFILVQINSLAGTSVQLIIHHNNTFVGDFLSCMARLTLINTNN